MRAKRLLACFVPFERWHDTCFQASAVPASSTISGDKPAKATTCSVLAWLTHQSLVCGTRGCGRFAAFAMTCHGASIRTMTDAHFALTRLPQRPARRVSRAQTMPTAQPELQKVARYRGLQEAVDELERELTVRSRCFPRWVTEGRVSRSDAIDRLDRMATAHRLCSLPHARMNF